MRAHCKAEVLWRLVELIHQSQLGSELVRRIADMPVPVDGALREPYPAEILVAGTVAEPAPHLKEGVVHPCTPPEVTDHETFQGEAARQAVTADRHDTEP